MVVDCAIYESGARISALSEAIGGIRSRLPSREAFAWIGLLEPTEEEFAEVRQEFGLHELAVEDAVKAHQRPKLELYGDTVFLVLKTVLYREPDQAVEIGEVLVFLGRDFLITVRHGEGGGLGDVREKLQERPDLLARGPSAGLHALVDRVVDAYQPALDDLAADIEEVEAEVFSESRANPVQRIYQLRLETSDFNRAASLLRPAVERLAHDDVPHVDPDVRAYFRDVADHLARICEQLDSDRELLTGVLQANLTQVTVRQNEDMRRISAWVAILAVPTMIAGIYGMNFDHMPELRWRLGYPLVLAVILVVCGLLHRRFRHSGWL